MTTELKPCPFCGGLPKLHDRQGDGFLLPRVRWQNVTCSGCRVSTDDVQPYGDVSAIAAWNRRAPEAA